MGQTVRGGEGVINAASIVNIAELDRISNPENAFSDYFGGIRAKKNPEAF